jgi:hypothetical protein
MDLIAVNYTLGCVLSVLSKDKRAQVTNFRIQQRSSGNLEHWEEN